MSGIFRDAVSFWKQTVADALCIIHGVTNARISDTQMNNIRAGNQLAMMANLTPRKSQKVYKWSDFYADMNSPSAMEPQTPDEIASRLRAYFGGISHGA